MTCWNPADSKCAPVPPLTCRQCHRGLLLTAIPLAAVLGEACKAAVSFPSERAPHHFSISDRRSLHRALILQWLFTLQSLIHSRVQLIIGKAGKLPKFHLSCPTSDFTLSELNQLSLYSYPRSVLFEREGGKRCIFSHQRCFPKLP